MKFKAFLALVVAIASFCSAPLYAAQITGTINLMGDFQPTIGGVTTQNMALANGIDFLPLGGGMGAFSTGSATGDLAAFANKTGGSIKDFTFNPFAPTSTFYSITTGGQTLSFDLAGLTIDSQSASFLDLSGTGTLHLTGFDNTSGTWNFSGQSTNGASPHATFSWSAGTAAFPEDTPRGVPEPGTMSLLGLGLIAAGSFRRRKQA